MEQQTISIAKAGVSTILNARTSVLAAANPVYNSRYDKTKTPHENINMPESLLSRFDLIFILLDKPNKENDNKLAEHITYVHKNHGKPPTEQKELYDPDFLKNYIAFARQFNPVVPEHLHQFITDEYVRKRKKESNYKVDKTKYAYTTPRTLLGIIRLAQGIAKLRFSNEVSQDDIREAMRLMDSSQESLKPDKETLETKRSNTKADKMTKIFNIVKSIVPPDGRISLKELENQIVSRGINLNDLEQFLDTYNKNEMILYSKENDYMQLI